MTATDQIRAWRAAAPNFRKRQRKSVGQIRYGWNHPKTLCFVFGCQRSGTKMLMRILENSPATRIYHENNELAFHDFQLRSDRTVRLLTTTSPAPSQIFKPICDSHLADQLLERFPEANGLWIYRHYDDVAGSASQKWGSHQREVIDAVAAGDLARWGWRTERLSDTVLAAIRRVHRPDLSDHEGGMLFWYMRNACFFERGVHAHPRMVLKNYEELVRDPARHFPEVFAHVGAPFESSFIARVHADSVGRREPPVVSAEIRALCAELMARLDGWVRVKPTPSSTLSLPSPVLMLINTLGVGGAERHVVTMANWLAARGVAVTVAAEGGDLVAELHASTQFVATPLRRVRADLPLAARQVRAILRDRQPAVIVANSLAVTLIARVAQPRGRVPIVNIAHGWPDDRYQQVGPLLRVADVVIAVSPEVKAKLVAGGLDPKRCEVVLNGVDCTHLGPRVGATRQAAREAMGAGPEDILVLSLGRLTPQKAHHHMIGVAARLRKEHPLLRYAIVGEGARAQELRDLITAAGLTDVVRLPGLRADGPDLLGSADIYLSPSDWEGMPLSTIEAMASGLPTVATRTEGAGLLLTEECGFIVPIGDVEGMATQVGRLAANPELRARLGAASRERALASFGHDRMAKEIAAILGRVTSGR